MRYQRLDLNLLTALRALLSTRSVTRAAESLFLSQSAMSGILARLREHFDDQLIVHVGRRMELTPLGEGLQSKVSDLLLMVDATLGTKPEFTPETSKRHFILLASDYVISVLLLDVLREMNRSAPGVTMEFRQPTRTAFQDLEAGEVDFVIAPEWYTTPGFSSVALFNDTYSVVVDKESHEWGDSISLEQYKGARHVGVQNQGAPMFDAWFDRQHPTQRRQEISVSSFNLLPRVVIGTKRIATMHTRLAMQAAEHWPIRVINLGFEYPPFVEMLEWHNYRNHDPGLVWMREQIVRHSSLMPTYETV